MRDQRERHGHALWFPFSPLFYFPDWKEGRSWQEAVEQRSKHWSLWPRRPSVTDLAFSPLCEAEKWHLYVLFVLPSFAETIRLTFPGSISPVHCQWVIYSYRKVQEHLLLCSTLWFKEIFWTCGESRATG